MNDKKKTLKTVEAVRKDKKVSERLGIVIMIASRDICAHL